MRDLSKQEAMQGYIDEIKNIVETMPHNEFVNRLIKVIGPFYEFVDENESERDEEDDDDAENDNESSNVVALNGQQLLEMSSISMTNSYDMAKSVSVLDSYTNAKIADLHQNSEIHLNTNGNEGNVNIADVKNGKTSNEFAVIANGNTLNEATNGYNINGNGSISGRNYIGLLLSL